MLFSMTKIKPLCLYLAKEAHPKETTSQLALAVCQRPLEEFSSKTNDTEEGGSLLELFQEAAELGIGKTFFGYRCVRLMSVLSLLQNQALILQEYY